MIKKSFAVTILIVLVSAMLMAFQDSDQVLSRPIKDYPGWNESDFFSGKKLFIQDWVPTNQVIQSEFMGLGPHYSQTSCFSCHIFNGRSASPRSNSSPFSSLVKLASGNDEKSGPTPTSKFGLQLSYYASNHVDFESSIYVRYERADSFVLGSDTVELRKPTYYSEEADGLLNSSSRHSMRISPQIYGLGLIELIDEKDILSNGDIEDKDGDKISGRPNYVFNPASKKTELGRFGWKATTSSLLHQVALALWNDMGITNQHFVEQNCTIHPLCKKLSASAEPEIQNKELLDIVNYVKWLDTPTKKSHEILPGFKVFNELRCSSCHTPSFPIQLGDDQIEIYPYSDFLLHDMGTELADGFPEFVASGSEWRTPPLWGLEKTKAVNNYLFLMHDGRATTYEEAILWHGGEAEKSKQRFLILSEGKRNELIKFLKSI